MLTDTKLQPEILEDALTVFLANQDLITDMNEGSTAREILYAFARGLEDVYLKLSINIPEVSRNFAQSVFNFERKIGDYATGDLQFTLGEPKNELTSIPAGFVVYSGSGKSYATTQELIIARRDTKGTIAAKAVERGVDSNTSIATITTLSQTIDNLDSVNNELPFVGGIDSEDDEAYLQRFAEYILSLGSSNDFFYKSVAKSIDGVRDCLPVTKVPPEAIQGQLYNLILYIDDGAATATQEILDKVRNKIFEDDVTGESGILSGGIACYITAAQKLGINIEADIVTDGLVPLNSTKQLIELAVAGYVNSLKIGQEVQIAEIIKTIKIITNVVDCNVTLPVQNIVVNPAQVAKLDKLTLTLSLAS